ncbi:MAG TPA: HlyD family efflux transporter periplasmic adaptor subunit [Nannocystaceae bacterium]|nr:HlyD family efflux transporter periplasmic adaptor subunit [Nannocystaceae bacterium]
MRLAWLLAIAIGVAACTRDDEGIGDVPTFEVERSEAFVRNIRADGILKAVEATPITAPQDARGPLKIAWLAPDGSRVAAGDVVIRFDESEMERRLADSKDDVTSAERQIGKVEVESAASRGKRERTAELADLETKVAKQFETTDEKILSRVEIIEGAIDLEFAEARAEHARTVKKVERSVSSSQLQLHRIDKSHHSQSVAHAQDGLAKLQITAPQPGVVVLMRHWNGEVLRVGDTVWSGQTLAELPHVAELQAEVFVLEADAGSLVEGLPAEVVVEAHPAQTWAAKVKRVDTLAQPRHPDVPVHYFGLTLALERTDTEVMRVGQRVRATVRVERADAIVVPRQAVFDRDGRTVVYREGSSGFAPVDVVLGPASAGRVVIESGLEPGERVALRDPTRAASELLADSDGQPAESRPRAPGAGR